MAYRGRFAPSPTGPLHDGSLVAALGSWLDARAHHGTWLVRIEDVDTPRCVPGADRLILEQLALCGLLPDEAVLYQSRRSTHYAQALSQLQRDGWVYPCGCTRRDIEAAGGARPRHGELVYPGTCREGLHGKPPRAQRVRTMGRTGAPTVIDWLDRRLGPQRQDLAQSVGDFVLHRADGLWAYQLAVVVDDGDQGITHVVRGEDLADNTPRQIHLQQLLHLARPNYLHLPLVLAADGRKLSKQNGASALDLSDPLAAMKRAGAVLDVDNHGRTPHAWLQAATLRWAERHP